MFRDHMLSFLEAVIVFLLITNALSVLVATCAVTLLNGFRRREAGSTFIERKLNAILRDAT